MSEQGKSLSGLSAEEARAFHGLFVSSMVIFTVIATVAITVNITILETNKP
jgi:hypothetical protein